MITPPAKRSKQHIPDPMNVPICEADLGEEPDSQDLNNWTFNSNGWKKSDKWQGFYEACLDDKFENEGVFSIPAKENYLIRDCYSSLGKQVRRLSELRLPVLIVGQPGTGKTVALYFLLGHALSHYKSQPSVLVTTTDVYVFYDKLVWEIETSRCRSGRLPYPSGADVFCQVFVDWDGPRMISEIFLHIAYTIVQATSSNPRNFAWRKQVIATGIALPHWRKGEIVNVFSISRGAKRYLHSLASALSKQDDQDTSIEAHPAVLLLRKWWEEARMKKSEQAEVQEGTSGSDDRDLSNGELTDSDVELVLEREVEKDVKKIQDELASLPAASDIPLDLAVKILVTVAMRHVGLCPRDIYEHIRNPPRPSAVQSLGRLARSVIAATPLQMLTAKFIIDLTLDSPVDSVLMATPLLPGRKYVPSNRCVVEPGWVFTLKSAVIREAVTQPARSRDSSLVE
ncbi:hypothetical protein V5O48_003360 [Marasmius crinis-equi]|uniref:Uncharacterized protein n=1 Tax=Marasmius crinis-equi TaxID=585013 RepID=A0ABR3FT50_9AGAR